MRFLSTEGSLGNADTGAIDCTLQAAKYVQGSSDGGAGAGFVRDIGAHEPGGCAAFLGKRLARGSLQIGDDHVGLVSGKQSGCSGSQAGSAAADEKCAAWQLH